MADNCFEELEKSEKRIERHIRWQKVFFIIQVVSLAVIAICYLIKIFIP